MAATSHVLVLSRTRFEVHVLCGDQTRLSVGAGAAQRGCCAGSFADQCRQIFSLVFSVSLTRFIILLQVMNNSDEINYFFNNNYQNKSRDLREAHIKSLNDMEELKRVQELRIDDSSRTRLIENQDTINELTARIQELQNEVNLTREIRKMWNQRAVDYPTFPVVILGDAEPQ